MTEYATSADGTRIAFDRYGSGPAVIFVAAAMQFRAFAPQTAELAKSLADRGFTVAVYDRRGRGESVGPGPFTLAAELADLRAVIDAVGGRASLVGNSSGGAIALAAASAGLPVTAVALWEVPLGAELGSEGAEFLAGLRERVDAGDEAGTIEFYMQDMPPEWLERARQSPAWPVMTAISATLVPDAEALAWTQSAPHTELFGLITAPVLAMHGSESLSIFPPAARAVAAAVPDGRVATVPGRDHGWEVGAMSEALAGFLRE
ncbi:MAG TPA: alpha/beta fold hydrolase [Actinomycetota bacterium]|nr:alpha/beta fold hydrolase [Actinomycetota bacterium]